MRFVNRFADRIYKYIYIHDDEFLLLKKMSEDLKICQPTLRKYIRWLERRGYIEKKGKHFKIIAD